VKTEQVNIRLEADVVAALERVAREENIDRSTTIQRLLKASLEQWQTTRALLAYQRGEMSLGRAAEEAGLTQWELIDEAKRSGIAYPLDAEDVRERLAQISPSDEQTLPDIRPKPGGVLLVGINPAPVSVAAGHYYQGRLGRRLWRRLQRIGLLTDAVPGAEDDAFSRSGHGLTDLVKRPAASSKELSRSELVAGAEQLRQKIAEWRPGLILFAFKEPALQMLGGSVKPGPGPEVEGIPTFLLSGPYAPRDEAERVDAELSALLASSSDSEGDTVLTQPVTEKDRERGQIRLPRLAKRFFPTERGDIEVVLRGQRLSATYDPRLGPDRERSAVIRIGRAALNSLVTPGERLRVSQARGGVPILD
jgi:TDG/mug DNA glycosylase family protein